MGGPPAPSASRRYDAAVNRSTQLAAFLGPAISLLVGLTVLVGWFTRTDALLQLHPSWVPMQLNTALGFAALGVAGALFAARRSALAPGAFVALVGAATLAQYGFDVDLGIDELLMESHLVVETSHPGRMAPNTALCFVLLGAALAVGRRRGALVQALAATLAGALSGMALAGYVSGVEPAYGWGELTRMAAHTAATFVFASFSLAVSSWADEDIRIGGVPRWLPIPVGTFIAALGLIAAQVAAALDQAHLVERTHQEAEAAGRELETDLANTVAAVIRMGERWDEPRGMPEELWRPDARSYVRDQRGLLALEWVDGGGVVRWVEPLAGNEAAVGLDLTFEERRAEALRRAESTREPVASRPIELVQGGPGVLLFVALADRGGFMLGVFHPSTLASALLPLATLDDHCVAIRGDGTTLFDNGKSCPKGFSSTMDVAFAGRTWSLTLSPTAETVRDSRSPLPAALVGSGFALGLAGAALVLFGMRARQTAVEVEALNAGLVEGTRRLEEANTELARSNADLDDFAFIAAHDLKAPARDIWNLAGWLTEDLEGSLPEDSERHLQTLRQRSERMSGLLDDLLVYARAGREAHEPVEVELRQLVVEAAEIAAVPDSFQLELPPACTVHIERVPLLQVLVNLLGNAVKHHDRRDGRIAVEIVVGEKLDLRVIDDGPGIPPHQYERVFRMFQTLKPRDEVEGSGLGLALCRKLVERHGGTIRVVSQGRDTAFHVTWPMGGACEPSASS